MAWRAFIRHRRGWSPDPNPRACRRLVGHVNQWPRSCDPLPRRTGVRRARSTRRTLPARLVPTVWSGAMANDASVQGPGFATPRRTGRWSGRTCRGDARDHVGRRRRHQWRRRSFQAHASLRHRTRRTRCPRSRRPCPVDDRGGERRRRRQVQVGVRRRRAGQVNRAAREDELQLAFAELPANGADLQRVGGNWNATLAMSVVVAAARNRRGRELVGSAGRDDGDGHAGSDTNRGHKVADAPGVDRGAACTSTRNEGTLDMAWASMFWCTGGSFS